jgi:2-oxo-hept-3-ene-1,7-dioate hydratase
MTIDDSYAIQRAWLKTRLAEGAGQGAQIGLTSRAMQQASQIDEPTSRRCSTACSSPAAAILIDRFIAPRVEVELAFVLARPLQGPGVTLATFRRDEVVTPAVGSSTRIEQFDRETKAPQGLRHDRRFRAKRGHRHRRFRCARTRSTCAGSARALQERRDRGDGLAAGVLDHPGNGVVWLANKIAAYGERLDAGDVVLGGSFTRPTPALRGDVFHVDYGRLGAIDFHFA